MSKTHDSECWIRQLSNGNEACTCLTKRQREVLRTLRKLTRAAGYQPSLRELGAALEPPVVQTNAVSDHLKALERKGWIKRTPGRARGIEVLK